MAIDKVRLNLLRRAAARRGLILRKSPRRDPGALDFDLFALMDARSGALMHAPGPLGTEYALTFEEVEAALRVSSRLNVER